MQVRSIKEKLPKSVKRITILKASSTKGKGAGDDNGSSDTSTAVVIKPKRKKKKHSKGLIKIWERLARRSADANQRAYDDYASRHERSNRKRRDGWLRDYSYNWLRAQREGGKKLKLSKLFG